MLPTFRSVSKRADHFYLPALWLHLIALSVYNYPYHSPMKAKDVKEREKVKKIETELSLKIIKPGDAVNYPKYGDSVSVHYSGFLEDGTCFDDSNQRGQPVFFVLGAEQVLRGWEMVLPILSRGEKARIVLQPELAYGDKGYPPIIPPKAVLTFEVELLTFSSQGTAERRTREKKAKADLLAQQKAGHAI